MSDLWLSPLTSVVEDSGNVLKLNSMHILLMGSHVLLNLSNQKGKGEKREADLNTRM